MLSGVFWHLYALVTAKGPPSKKMCYGPVGHKSTSTATEAKCMYKLGISDLESIGTLL